MKEKLFDSEAGVMEILWDKNPISAKEISITAALMSAFFILFGITAGVFAGSFLLGKRKPVHLAPVGCCFCDDLPYVSRRNDPA